MSADPTISSDKVEGTTVYNEPNFDRRVVSTSAGNVLVRTAGTGPAVLLLHGFPQTSLMWRSVAPLLTNCLSVVAADLPGYGGSEAPHAAADTAVMSKRHLAFVLVEVMRLLGHAQFAIVGHDRGGRIAYRAAMDHPTLVSKVAVLDVVPTYEVWQRADARTMLAFWPFSLLAQPAPLPERLILGAPDAIVDNALSAWGSAPEAFPLNIREAYIDALRDPARVHMICEEYRAAAGIDRDFDQADLQAGRRVQCPLLALWSGTGGLASWYEEAGGPVGIWRRWANDVRGTAVNAGHFFPEELPQVTTQLLRTFLLDEAPSRDAHG